MKYRNAQYVDREQTMIDAEIEHPIHGWIEITITQSEYPEVWASVTSKEVPLAEEVVRSREEEDALAARSTASMDRGEFCIALRNAKVLNQQQAIQAARGDWIDFFRSALNANANEMNPDDAEIVWAAMNRVYRSHTLVEVFRRYGNLTPMQMDRIFGLIPPV